MADFFFKGRRLVLALAAVLGLGGCDDSSTTYAPSYADSPVDNERVYVLGIHPLHNPETMYDVYQPLIDYLNAHLGDGVRIKLEASRSYADFERKLYSRQFEFALPNSMQIGKSTEEFGYHAFAKMDDDSKFCGIILVRRDGGIRTVADLKGKSVSYPAPTALAATMLPQVFLKENGLDLHRDINNIYVGSQESSILSVYLGKVAAAATWPPPWIKFQHDFPDKAAQLEVKWSTRGLPHNGFVARDDMPPALVDRVRALLVHMQDSEEGRALLARVPVDRFVPADDATYQPTRDYVRWFTANVRRPEDP